MRKVTALLIGLLLTFGLVLPASAATAGAYGVVADSLGRPVVGAQVEVYRLGQGLVSLLTTDSHGGFRLDSSVQSGSLWQLRVWAKGYRTAETGWIDLARDRYQAVTLEPLTGSLQITVRDEFSLPLAGQVQVADAAGRVIYDGRVEKGGPVSLDLLAGTYSVSLRAPGRAPTLKTATVTSGKSATLLLLPTGAAVAVSGEVRDAISGLPVAGATVELLTADQALVYDAGRADDAGHFRLGAPAAAAGTYLLRVSAKGYRDVATQPLSLAPGQEKDLSGKDGIALAKAVGTVGGTIVKQDGTPGEGLTVALDAKGYGQVAVFTALKDGSFAFEGVPTDPAVQYRVRIVTPSENGATGWQAFTPGVTDQLVLQSKQLSLGSTDFGQGSISGVVVTPAGQPVKGAKVELFRRNILQKTLETDAEGAFRAEVISATRGSSQWLVSEPYTVRISKDGFVTTTEANSGGQDTTEFPVAVWGRTALKATLRPTAAPVRGRVVGADGKPIAGAEVYLMNGLGPVAPMERTDADGWYTFRSVAMGPSNLWVLRAKAEGYLPVSGVSVSVAAGALQPLPTLKMAPAKAVFTGQVLDDTGRPVTGVHLTATGPDGAQLGTAQSDEAGVYRIEADYSQSAPVVLTARRSGYSTVSAQLADLQVGGSRTTQRDLVILPATGVLSGRVLGEDGVPRPQVKVELLEEGRGVVATATTDATGTYAFPPAPLDGSGWFWVRIDPTSGLSAGSLRHDTELVPLIRLMPGEETVLDLLVR